ncbi:MAG TPA: M20/M25/M40 family metallo-hydrolase [Propionibacteriaceae bacterium]
MSLRDQVQAELPGVLADLKELVAIESVSADSARTTEVQRSAEHIVQLLADLKCPDVSIIRAKDGAPAVLGRFPAPEGKPTVCLYAHHDVQPEGDPAAWRTPPFVATELEGRLYGRGVTDDKGGFAVHLAALRAFGGKPPVGVTVFVEGEEEIGSPTLPQLLEDHYAELAADVFVITDSDNWAVGPASLHHLPPRPRSLHGGGPDSRPRSAFRGLRRGRTRCPHNALSSSRVPA